jgi:hypothetical protein
MSLSKIIRSKILGLADLQQLDRKCAAQGRVNSPIVSLTTVPRRIGLIKPTIVSLLKQRLAPKEIHINIGADYFGKSPVPEFLNDLQVVKVFAEPKDCGPATKYLYTLKRVHADQLLVILDDDMYYPDTLIEDLVQADAHYGQKSAVCINGLRVPKSFRSFDRESDREIKSGSKRVAIVEGCGGYTLRGRFFKTDLFNLTGAPARAFFDDDFWVSGHLSRNQIAKYQIAGRKKRKSLVNTIESAISGDREALQSEMMKHFAADWKEDELV